MLRPAAQLVALVTILSVAPAAPAPDRPPVYWPLRVGFGRVYQADQGDVTLVVTDVGEKDGALIVEVGLKNIPDGKVSTHQVMSVSPEGVFLLVSGGDHYDPPNCLLKLPHRDGQKWAVDSAVTHVEGRHGMYDKGVRVASRRERVRVPAGE